MRRDSSQKRSPIRIPRREEKASQRTVEGVNTEGEKGDGDDAERRERKQAARNPKDDTVHFVRFREKAEPFQRDAQMKNPMVMRRGALRAASEPSSALIGFLREFINAGANRNSN